MKKSLLSIVLLSVSFAAFAQQPAPQPVPAVLLKEAAKAAPAPADSIIDASAFIGKGIVNWWNSSSNKHGITIAPYGTYFPNTKGVDKYGGGIFAAYKINDNLSAGIGLDYLGKLWMPSGDINLKTDIHPFAGYGLTNFAITPFALAGIALPIAGAGNDNGSAAAIAGAGMYFKVACVKGGDVSLGYALVNWANAGDYSGVHHQLFLSWRKGF